jgi:S-DNA-T family DNA segregation ATPase FtsK/SpoIIIE
MAKTIMATTNRSTTRGREVTGILLLGLALFLLLSVGSLQLGHGTLMGPCGAVIGTAIYALVGVGAYLLAFAAGAAAVYCLTGRELNVWSWRTLWRALGLVAGAMLVHLLLGRFRLRGFPPGGLVGEYAAELVASMVGRIGAGLVGVTWLAAAVVLSTSVSLRGAVELAGRAVRLAGRGCVAAARWLWRAIVAIFPERNPEEDSEPDIVDVKPARALDETKILPVAEPKRRRKMAKEDETQVVTDDQVVTSDGVPVAVDAEAERTEACEPPKHEEPEVKIAEPVIVEPSLPKAKEEKPTRPDYIPAPGGYHLPQLDVLDVPVAADNDLDRQSRDEMLALADKLQRTLADYGVRGNVQEIHPGPVVTMYEFVPAAGTKLSKITSLSNDLAMALAALRVRIVAPIPGKSSVGIEVPNKKRATVYLREILGDDAIQKTRSRLSMGLGKDISGAPVAVDLAKMPHLLVAGTTGSGKSVGINGMICSVLFNATPEEVRLIMIDPKMVELSVYEGIPHLLLPVVTDPKKANLALRWAVEEMERRYELVSKAGVRDILSYNKRVEKLAAEPPPEVPEGEEAPAQETKLPYIVVVIDEFADLMMVAPKDVETSVARIAQKARAVGIHLIVATQRPSVDVITGLIKANFPSRIGFQVASKIDSRTILDQQGAENLLGNGDMLFTDRGQALRRVHGAFVSDDEVKRLVAFLKTQGKPVYDLDILKPRDEEGEEGLSLPSDEGADPLYDQAVRLVCDTRMASVSMIQRRLQIGFNRASRLVERMEREGIVGAANGSKPREVIAQAI